MTSPIEKLEVDSTLLERNSAQVSQPREILLRGQRKHQKRIQQRDTFFIHKLIIIATVKSRGVRVQRCKSVMSPPNTVFIFSFWLIKGQIVAKVFGIIHPFRSGRNASNQILEILEEFSDSCNFQDSKQKLSWISKNRFCRKTGTFSVFLKRLWNCKQKPSFFRGCSNENINKTSHISHIK